MIRSLNQHLVFGISPKIEGSTGFLIGQRAKHFGLAFAIDLRIPEKRPHLDRTLA